MQLFVSEVAKRWSNGLYNLIGIDRRFLCLYQRRSDGIEYIRKEGRFEIDVQYKSKEN